MNNQFISEENKALIWQFLIDANAFINIPEKYFDQVKKIYETTLYEINKLNNITLLDKNKTIIAEMMKRLSQLKNKYQLQPLEEVKITVNENFKNKQQEFISLVNHKPPSEPTFSENIDEPLDSADMNNILNNMMAMREKELNQVQPPEEIINKKEQLDNQKLDNQKLDNQKLDNQKLDNQKLDNQKLDNQKLDNQKLDNQKLDKDNIQKLDSNMAHDGSCMDYMWSQWADETNKFKKVSFETDFISKLKKKDIVETPNISKETIDIDKEKIQNILKNLKNSIIFQEKIYNELNSIL